MRIFLRLRSLKDCAYDLKYFHKLQGFVYSLIRDSPYSLLHDKKGNKFFCFSNLFPVRSIRHTLFYMIKKETNFFAFQICSLLEASLKMETLEI